MGKGRLGLGRVAPAPASVCYALPCAGGDGELGGKGAQLNLLFKSFGAGNRRLGVPDAIVVPARCYRARGGARARAAERCDLPDDLRKEIAAFAARHGSRGVACRSSASCEDALDASYAGQFETVLNCASAAACEDGVRKVWASTLAAGVLAYAGGAARLPKFLKAVAMAVVLQRQVRSDAAGVLFTVNPRNGCEAEAVVEAVFGQGEGLVSGLVTPDSYWVDTLDAGKPRFLRERVARKEQMIVAIPGGGGETVDVPEASQRDRVLRGATSPCSAAPAPRSPTRSAAARTSSAVTATMDGPASVGPWRGANDGTWERDAHATRPVPPMNDFFGDVLADEVTRADQVRPRPREAALRPRQRHPYLQPVPLGAPDPPPVGPPPPGPVLAALSRLHPALRKNDRVARRTLKCRGWMADIRAWKDTERAAREAAARALGAVDPGQLGDGALADHAEAVAVEMAKAWASHQRYTAPCLLTTAAVFARCDPGDAAGRRSLLADVAAAGSNRRDFWDHSPDRPLYEAFSACPEALKALGWARKVVRSKSDSAAAIYLGEVVDAASPVREAAADYLAARGGALARPAAEAGELLRHRNRPRSRPEKLLHWEHRCKGRADRARAFNQMLDSPAVINGPRHPPPQLGKWFPKGGCGELTDAFLAVINVALMGSDCEDEFAAGNLAPGAAVLRGMPASSGAEGALRARVRVVDEATFPELRRGEVAVLNFTNSSFNAYLNRCGAVVTNTGGALSHAAICAREAAIPAVCGCAHATCSRRATSSRSTAPRAP
ncbi:Pyruvate phosphate dikinase [Aureococcus anophagefferens]|nr:Pyruvate phosphate dikinase [Aureococcus anophagefferens]